MTLTHRWLYRHGASDVIPEREFWFGPDSRVTVYADRIYLYRRHPDSILWTEVRSTERRL